MNNGQDVHQNTTRNGYRTAFNRLLAEGDTGVYYLNGSGKLCGPIATDFQAQAGPIAGCHVSNYAFAAFAHYIGVSPSLNDHSQLEPGHRHLQQWPRRRRCATVRSPFLIYSH